MAPASAPRSVPSPRLSEKLIRTLLRYEAAIEAFPLTSAEQTRLEQMRTELATNPQRFFADCRPFRSPLLTNASDRRPADRHGLEQHELQQLDQDGFLPPRPVPGAKAIIEGAESLLGIYARTGQHSGLMQHLHLYHPRASAALIDNIDFFVDQAMSIFDTSRDRLLIDTQVFSSRLPAPIHTDYPAEQFFDLDRLPRMLHFHVNLRMPPGARGLQLYRGTHREIVFPRYALQALLQRRVLLDIDLALKSLVLSERCPGNEVSNLSSRDTRHLLDIHDGAGGKVRIHDFNLGTYLSLRYFMEVHRGTPLDASAVHFAPALGESVVFNPSILHLSDEATHGDRLSLAVRIIELPSPRAFQVGPLFYNESARWFYRRVVGTGLDRLADTCVPLRKLIEHLPHRERLAEADIKRLLFGGRALDANAEVNLSFTPNEAAEAPFIRLDRLRDLHRAAGFMP